MSFLKLYGPLRHKGDLDEAENFFDSTDSSNSDSRFAKVSLHCFMLKLVFIGVLYI